jgi:hypothetical protein
MKIGIMQPYFFPYVGYYSLIKYTNYWIVFDNVQFIRHGWIERNKILKPSEGWQYIQVPLVKHSRETLIKDINIRDKEPWREKIVSQLQHYKKKAPYFNTVIKLVEEAIALETTSIVELNAEILKVTCSYLGIDFKYDIYSKMNLEIASVKAPDEWALNISSALGATEYVNPPGGKEFFNKEKYEKKGIKLTFLQNMIGTYAQNKATFEAGLSIIDLLMFNSIEEVNNLIDNYELS